MARWFRLWEKKRGGRRTGSNLRGRVGEALFFIALMLLGSGALVALLGSLAAHGWPASQYFPDAYFRETSAVAEGRRLLPEEGAEQPPRYRPEILISYTVDGKNRRKWTYDLSSAFDSDRAAQQAILARFKIGQEYRCWYDPEDPRVVVLQRRPQWGLTLTLLVLASFVLIGGGGVIYTVLQVGTSAERRSALAKRAADIDLISDVLPSARDYPHVPSAADQTNSPGTKLAYRLPIQQAHSWRLMAAALFCLAWNGAASVLAVLALRGHLSGQADWFLTLFTVPFLVLGGWSIYYLIKELRTTAWIGPTNVEISDHPLRPGERYEVFLSQAGHLPVEALRLLLVCDEVTTYRQGTDVRDDLLRVRQIPIFCRQRTEIHPGQPFEHHCHLEIPPDSMHSFHSDHNAVHWKLVVEGKVAGWPDTERSFPLVVYPARVGEDGDAAGDA